jgi:cytochrome c556
MSRKWIGFLAPAALIVALGMALAGPGPSRAQDEPEKEKQPKHKETETELGKIMEKVQKANIGITKATRNAASYKRSQRDVEKLAREMVKLSKDAKPHRKEAIKNAKNEPNPEKKWDEIMDAWAKTSEELAAAVAKPATTQKNAKDLFQSMKKTCSDCHTVFRVEEEF